MFESLLTWQILAGVLLTTTALSVYYAIKFGFIILKVQDTIEGALDIMDERYARISSILSVPIYSDSNEIRKVVEDISVTRNAILEVAQQFASVDDENEKDISEAQVD